MVDSANPWDRTRGACLSTLGTLPPVVSRYLGTGGGAAIPLTASEVAAIHTDGCKLLPVFNDLNPSRLQTPADATSAWAACAIQAQRLNIPAGVYIGFDLESGWVPSDAWWQTFLAHVYASQWGGVGLWYCAASSPAILEPPVVPYADRMLYWRASWVHSDLEGLVWRRQALCEVAWQWRTLGVLDLSWVDDLLPSVGPVPEGLW